MTQVTDINHKARPGNLSPTGNGHSRLFFPMPDEASCSIRAMLSFLAVKLQDPNSG